MRHDVHDYLYFDDHDGPVHVEEAAAVLTLSDTPVVVAEGLRHRHLAAQWVGVEQLLDLASLWITKQINRDRVVLIRAPGQIELAAMFAAAVLLDAGLPVEQALAIATPPGVELAPWMRDLLT